MRPPAVVMWTGVAVLLILNIVVGAIIFIFGALMAAFSLLTRTEPEAPQ